MPTRPTAGLLGAIDRRPSVRLAAMLLIGIGIAMLAHWSVQILAPTMEEPAVVSSSERVGEYCRRAASCSPTFETRAVTAGATVTIPKSIPTGRPIRIVRSVVEDQIEALRSPDEMIDFRTNINAMVKCGSAGVFVVVGLLVGLRGWRRGPVAPSALVVVGALITGGVLFAPAATSSERPDVAPSAMQGYADPPTDPAVDPDLSTRRVQSIVGRGVTVASESA